MNHNALRAVLIAVCLAAVSVPAGHGEFYTDPGLFKTISNANCPSGTVVQSIHLYTGSTAQPPDTNAAMGYLDPAEQISNSPQLCERMGTDLLYSYYFGDGCLGALISGPGSSKHGYVRAFSSTTILGSAYYGNSPCVPIANLDTGASDNPITNNVAISSVNPAYLIFFTQVPNSNGPGTHVVGTVSCGSGDNQLPAALLRIEVRLTNSSAWVDTIAPNTDGTFSILPTDGAGVYAVQAYALSARTRLPVSAIYQPVYIIPEPAALLAVVLALMCLRRRG